MTDTERIAEIKKRVVITDNGIQHVDMTPNEMRIEVLSLLEELEKAQNKIAYWQNDRNGWQGDCMREKRYRALAEEELRKHKAVVERLREEIQVNVNGESGNLRPSAMFRHVDSILRRCLEPLEGE